MPDYADDAVIWPMAVQLAECLCAQIADRGLPEPCFCGVIPGEAVALDYCTGCDDSACGMAWVRVAGVGTRLGFVDQRSARSTSGCQVVLEATFEIGIVRCAPMPGSDGSPPSMAAQLDAAQLQLADMAAALRAANCCFDTRDVQLDGWVPIGPLGGCLGGAWSVTVGQV